MAGVAERTRELDEELGPDESGLRVRPRDQELEIEVQEVMVEPAARRRSIPPPIPEDARGPERVDLDAVIRTISTLPPPGARRPTALIEPCLPPPLPKDVRSRGTLNGFWLALYTLAVGAGGWTLGWSQGQPATAVEAPPAENARTAIVATPPEASAQHVPQGVETQPSTVGTAAATVEPELAEPQRVVAETEERGEVAASESAREEAPSKAEAEEAPREATVAQEPALAASDTSPSPRTGEPSTDGPSTDQSAEVTTAHARAAAAPVAEPVQADGETTAPNSNAAGVSEATPSMVGADKGAAPSAASNATKATPTEPPGAPETSPAPAELPPAPSRAQVDAAMQAIRGEMERCADGAHGLATARIVIRGNGRVSSALINGSFAGSPAGSCMARTLRSAQLPPFAQQSLVIEYPFRL